MRSKYWEERDLERIKAYLNPEQRTIAEIAIQTGLRISDVLALRRNNLSQDKEGWWITTTAQKTGKEGRWKIQTATAKKIKDRRGWLFPGKKPRRHLTRQTVWKGIKRACDEAAIDKKGKSPHSYRKIYAVKERHAHGLSAAREGLQHSNDALTRLYAYSDTFVKADRDEPIRWTEVELLVDYILERLGEKINSEKGAHLS